MGTTPSTPVSTIGSLLGATLYRRVRRVRAYVYRGRAGSPGVVYWYPGVRVGEEPPPGYFRVDYVDDYVPVGVDLQDLIAPAAVWLILYDDKDKEPEIWLSEVAARARYATISTSWNAHLFVKVLSNNKDDRYYSANAQVVDVAGKVPISAVGTIEPFGWVYFDNQLPGSPKFFRSTETDSSSFFFCQENAVEYPTRYALVPVFTHPSGNPSTVGNVEL
jgi:hypothetical protein